MSIQQLDFFCSSDPIDSGRLAGTNMVVVLPFKFPSGPFCRQDKLQRAYAVFGPEAWLHDEAIDLVHSQFVCSNGNLLPSDAWVAQARTSTLLALGGGQAVESAKVDCDLGARELLLVPINDTKWSLLLGWADPIDSMESIGARRIHPKEPTGSPTNVIMTTG